MNVVKFVNSLPRFGPEHFRDMSDVELVLKEGLPKATHDAIRFLAAVAVFLEEEQTRLVWSAIKAKRIDGICEASEALDLVIARLHTIIPQQRRDQYDAHVREYRRSSTE